MKDLSKDGPPNSEMLQFLCVVRRALTGWIGSDGLL